VDAVRLTINKQTPQQLLIAVNVETLVRHYREHVRSQWVDATLARSQLTVVSTAKVVRTSCDSNGTLSCLGLIEYAGARSDSPGASIVASTDLVVLHRPVELARASGHFPRTEAKPRCSRRGTEDVFHSVRIRDLHQLVDSSALAFLSLGRCKGGGRGSVAEDPATGSRNQGENSEYHECLVRPCHPVGLDGKESNHKCAPECEAFQNAGCAHTGGNQCIALQAARTSAHGPRNWTRLQDYGEENSSDYSGRMWISTNL
jgi:hypothetical protein